jgi:hypothetical protein
LQQPLADEDDEQEDLISFSPEYQGFHLASAVEGGADNVGDNVTFN